MQILFDARGVCEQSDGLGNYVRHLLTHLLRIDSTNEYVILMSPLLQQELQSAGLLERPRTSPVVTSIPLMGLSQQLKLPELVRRLPEATLYHYPHFDIPLRVHPRSVVTIFDLNHVSPAYFDSLRYPKWLYAVGATRLSVAKARHILTISQATKAQLLQRFPWLDSQSITVTHVGLNDRFLKIPDRQRLEAVRRAYRLGNDRFVLYVGTQRPHKNVRRLLEAYGRLRRSAQIHHKLLLVGSFHEDGTLSQRIKALGLNDSVVRLGYVADEALPLIYRLADAFVFCSLSEGFGMPLLEAMASEVPIVTSNCGALAEVAEDSAMLVDPWSIDAIAGGIYKVLTVEKLRIALINRGLRRVKDFTWEQTARKTLEIYTRIGREADGATTP